MVVYKRRFFHEKDWIEEKELIRLKVLMVTYVVSFRSFVPQDDPPTMYDSLSTIQYPLFTIEYLFL